jgi:hypothetical protein
MKSLSLSSKFIRFHWWFNRFRLLYIRLKWWFIPFGSILIGFRYDLIRFALIFPRNVKKVSLGTETLFIYSIFFARFLPLNVNTTIPPSRRSTPTQETALNTSPTINTLRTAAVKGSPRDKVTADEEGTF